MEGLSELLWVAVKRLSLYDLDESPPGQKDEGYRLGFKNEYSPLVLAYVAPHHAPRTGVPGRLDPDNGVASTIDSIRPVSESDVATLQL